MPPPKWKCLVKEISDRPVTRHSIKLEVKDHPLKPAVKMVKVKNYMHTEHIFDPLSMVMEDTDPLSEFAREYGVNEVVNQSHGNKEMSNAADVWSTRRTHILNSYTTVEKLSLMSSYLPGGEKLLVKQHSSVSDQVKHRLEQLDEFEDGSVRQMMNLSQQEYVSKINMLNAELVQAWHSEQRVKALKIAIQCSKLLVDTNVMQFYPSKFVLITDILDTFGKLVFERLKMKAGKNENDISYILPEEFNPDMVSESAKETCQNWLYKMASIRELVPRLYIEMSLLRCYCFLSPNDFDSAILRLTKMVRGIGNSLIAIYARCYLCRVGLNVKTSSKEYFQRNLDDFLMTYSQVYTSNMKKAYESQHLTLDTYLSLYNPALDWLLFGIVNYTQTHLSSLDQLLSSQQSNDNGLLLHSIITSYEHDLIAQRAVIILEYIAKCDSEVMKQNMLQSLGKHMCAAKKANLNENHEYILQLAWKQVSSLKLLQHYLPAAEHWIHFTVLNLSMKHLGVLLREITKHVSKRTKSVEELYAPLQNIIRMIVNSVDDIEELFLLESFLTLLDCIHSGHSRLEMGKVLLASYHSRCPNEITDSLVIDSLIRLCRMLHNSVSALTVEDESKLIAELICKFIRKVSFDDLEQQLAFYVDCRAAFINLDIVLICLVHCVNRLAATGVSGVRAKACSAYCFITIPSLTCPLARAKLYLLSGQVALRNQCIGQAEASFKASISLIPDIPSKHVVDGQIRSTQVCLQSLINSFLSTLLVVPDNVESGCTLYLLRGLLKAVKILPWEKTESSYYLTLLQALDLIANLAQEVYIYRIEDVTSNDLLYGSDPSFIADINHLSSLIMEELLAILKQLGLNNESKKQSHLALRIFWTIVKRADIREPDMETLAVNLWCLAHKQQDDVDIKLAENFMNAMKIKSGKTACYDVLLVQLNNRI